MNILQTFWSKVKRYPQRAQFVIQALLGVAVVFGLEWNAQQVAATLLASAGILAFLTEQNVTPTSDPVLEVGTAVTTSGGQRAVVVAQD